MDEAVLRERLGRAVDALGGRRRLLAAGLAAAGIAAALHAVHPATPATVRVWAAAHDLSGGRPLTPADLRLVALPVASVPVGAVRAADHVTGRLLAGPMRRNEPLTDVRLLEPALLEALPDAGLVAVPIRVADGAAVRALVGPGDLVDVLTAADPTGGGPTRAQVVASGVRVLAVPRTDGSGSDPGGLVVLAASREQASVLAHAGASGGLSLALLRP